MIAAAQAAQLQAQKGDVRATGESGDLDDDDDLGGLPESLRPYSGSKGWTWEPDRIEPEVGPVQIKFADVRDVAAGCSMISIPVPNPGHLALR